MDLAKYINMLEIMLPSQLKVLDSYYALLTMIFQERNLVSLFKVLRTR